MSKKLRLSKFIVYAVAYTCTAREFHFLDWKGSEDGRREGEGKKGKGEEGEENRKRRQRGGIEGEGKLK